MRYLLTAQGETLTTDSNKIPPCRNWIWWDSDLLRETLRGDRIVKWPDTTLTEGIEGAILMIADIEGDWREEIITAVGDEIRIYSTCIPATDRRTMLPQDPIYRSYIVERKVKATRNHRYRRTIWANDKIKTRSLKIISSIAHRKKIAIFENP